jgi:hypothetical protein
MLFKTAVQVQPIHTDPATFIPEEHVRQHDYRRAFDDRPPTEFFAARME